MKIPARGSLLTVALAAAMTSSLAQTAVPVTPAGIAQTIAQAGSAVASGAQAGSAAASAAQAAAAAAAVPPAPIVLPVSVLPPVGATEQPTSAGETALTLDVGHGIRRVPPSRVTVPAGETLLLTGPNSSGRPVQWFKNNRALPGATSPLFAIQHVTSADAGTYHVLLIDPLALVAPSQSLILGVGPTDRLLNLSTRATLAAGPGQSFTSGFIVAAGAGQTKRLVLRAVGPTLAAFGVANPLRAPVLRLFDAAGKPYANGYVYPAVVGGLTYETDLANALAATGAFPIAPGTLDAVVMMPFVAGAYTAHVTSGDNTSGTVLLEIYEVP